MINEPCYVGMPYSAGTTPKKWDPGVTALYTTPESDLWNRDPDPPKESDLSEDPDPFGIQFLIPNQFPVENKIFLAKNNGKMPWDETKCVIMKDCFQNLATNTQKRSGSSVGSGSFSGSGSLTKRSGSHLVDPKRAKRSGSRIPGVRVVPALIQTRINLYPNLPFSTYRANNQYHHNAWGDWHCIH